MNQLNPLIRHLVRTPTRDTKLIHPGQEHDMATICILSVIERRIDESDKIECQKHPFSHLRETVTYAEATAAESKIKVTTR